MLHRVISADPILSFFLLGVAVVALVPGERKTKRTNSKNRKTAENEESNSSIVCRKHGSSVSSSQNST